MMDLGTVKPGSTIRIPFSSFGKDDGSSITMTNYAAADILIYKDGSTTERASTSGFTATTDFDSKTGKHLAIIDLSDDTTADFFKAGSEYLVALDAVTVSAVTTGGWIARFRIGYPGAILDTSIATLSSQTSFTLTAGPAEDDALNGMWAVIHDKASAVQASWVLISDYTGSTKTVTLAAGAKFTAAAGDNISIMYPAPLQPATTGNTISLSSGAVLLQTGTGTGQLDFTSGVVKANVTQFGGSNGTFSSGRPEVNTTHIAGSAVSTSSAQIGVNVVNAGGTAWGSGAITAASIATGAITNAKFAAGAIDAAAIATDAIDADALAPDAAAEIADAVWEEAIADHSGTAGSTAEQLAAAGAAGDPWDTALPGAYSSGKAGYLVGTYLDAAVSAVKAKTDSLTFTVAGEVNANTRYFGGTAGTFSGGRPEVNATHWGGTAVASANVLIDGAITAAKIADGAIDAATFAADTGLAPIRTGTAQAGGSGTITLDASASSVNDFYAYAAVRITGGTGAGQVRIINGYNGTTKVASTPVAWSTTPDNTSTFAILPTNQWVYVFSVGNVALDDIGQRCQDFIISDSTAINGAALNTLSGHDPGETIMGATDLGTGSGFTAIPWNPSWDAEVQSEVEDGLVTHRLDELLNADSDIDGAAPPTVGSVFHELLSKTAGSFTFDQTTDSLEALRDRGDSAWTTATGFSTLTQADIRTAVGLASANLDTQLGDLPTNAEFAAAFPSNFASLGINVSGHLSRVTLVDTLTTYTGNTPQTGDAYAIVSSGTHGNAALKTLIDTVDTVVDAILVDTAELQGDWTNGGRLDLLVDAILDDTGTSGVAIAGATANKIADHTLRRSQANVEASSDGDSLSIGSIYGSIQANQEWAISGTTLTVYRTDGSTSLGTKTVSKTSGDDPIRGVS